MKPRLPMIRFKLKESFTLAFLSTTISVDSTLSRERGAYMEDPRLIPFREFLDERGTFQKILDPRNQAVYGLNDFSAVEVFTTTTKKHGIRGMHVQIQPYASRKIVWVTKVFGITNIFGGARCVCALGIVRIFFLTRYRSFLQ